jgi:hypothetical protein
MIDKDSIAQAAAGALSLRLGEPLPDRPLAWAWRASPAQEPPPEGASDAVLYVARDDALKGERQRFLDAGERILRLPELPEGVLRVRAVAPAQYAYAADVWTMGTAKDLPALGWPARRRLDFVRRVAAALERLHQAGIVHGCLCEENVLLDDDFRPVLAEAGAVSVHDLSERGGDAASYAAFAAPEVLEGAEPDTRSDVYALGRLLQHVLRSDDLPQVAELVRRCLAPAQAGRYATAAAVGVAIDALIAALPPEPTAAPAVARPAPDTKPKEEAGAGFSAEKGEPGPPATWPAPVGLVVAAASIGAAVLGAGSSDTVRSVLSGGLLAGAALASFALRPQPRTSLPLRVGFAVAVAALVAAADPLSFAYRSAAERAIKGSPDSRRAAIEQIVRLGRDFQGMSLAGADLSGADLRGADLRLTDLSRADLSGADLFGALLQGASLAGTQLAGADLRQADLGHAAHFDSALCSAKTQLSDPFRCAGGVLTEGPPQQLPGEEPPAPAAPSPGADAGTGAGPAPLEGGPGAG